MDRDDVERIRAFNRRWTEVIGLLDAGLLDTPYSLPEARVIFELGRRGDDEPWEQVELRRRLRMDPSYLTRIVARLRRAGLVTDAPVRRRPAATSASRSTPAGRARAPTSIAARPRRSAPSSIHSATMTGGGSGRRSTPSMTILDAGPPRGS